MEFALNNKETFALFLFEIRSNRSYYTSKTYDFVKNFTNMYRDVIIEGQRDKIFRPDVSPSMVCVISMGFYIWEQKHFINSIREQMRDMAKFGEFSVNRKPGQEDLARLVCRHLTLRC